MAPLERPKQSGLSSDAKAPHASDQFERSNELTLAPPDETITYEGDLTAAPGRQD